ncbi:hypothetical protein KHR68_004720 [Salmonella enterica subsp. enterica serovar Senftenberg]|nr:hypothetical protein [Salmonella enterica subsp. enterica serovar Senftenberg]EIT4065476.1 hypothetical protein [Salmonella enterica subsp. enterica serovar Senftenberg]
MKPSYEELEAKCLALAAENAGLKAGIRQASEDMEAHHDDHGLFSYDADGEQMDALLRLCDAQDSITSLMNSETPATDAFVAEVLASAIPEGYVLVPQEMHLSSEAMEGICFHCGDGDHKFGEFTDGTLFVGEVDYGDGKKVHGLHIATADYPEEGCATICDFAAQLRKGAAQ